MKHKKLYLVLEATASQDFVDSCSHAVIEVDLAYLTRLQKLREQYEAMKNGEFSDLVCLPFWDPSPSFYSYLPGGATWQDAFEAEPSGDADIDHGRNGYEDNHWALLINDPRLDQIAETTIEATTTDCEELIIDENVVWKCSVKYVNNCAVFTHRLTWEQVQSITELLE